jgi:hypothetical protein
MARLSGLVEDDEDDVEFESDAELPELDVVGNVVALASVNNVGDVAVFTEDIAINQLPPCLYNCLSAVLRKTKARTTPSSSGPRNPTYL